MTARRPPPPSYIRGPAPALRPAGPRGSRRSRPRAGYPSLPRTEESQGLGPGSVRSVSLGGPRRSRTRRKDGGGRRGLDTLCPAGGESFRHLLSSPPPGRRAAPKLAGKLRAACSVRRLRELGAFAFSIFSQKLEESRLRWESPPRGPDNFLFLIYSFGCFTFFPQKLLRFSR